VVILPMGPQVLGQLLDPLGQESNLHLGRPGVPTGPPVTVENLALGVLREGHDRRRLAKVQVPPGVAAGHPATADAGLEILAEGGTAADAAVAAALASCVAETVMTGIVGGGYALWIDAGSDRADVLDFFVAVPGLGSPRGPSELEELAVPFGEELVHYFVGAATCAVPGVPAGLDELWRRGGTLPWRRLVEPALRLAETGVPMPPAHARCLAMLAPVMTMREGGRIYSPNGRLLEAGDVLEQPGLVAALEVIAAEGARTFYGGTLAESLLALMEDRDGLVTSTDLSAYAVEWLPPLETPYAGVRVQVRGGLASLVDTLKVLPPLRGLPQGERALALARILAAPPFSGRTYEHTTNLCAVDTLGNACVVTTSLGLGSGDFLPGYDVHLNSMLGESDLLIGPLTAGERMESMMSPTAAFDTDGLVLVAGAAGGTRLRPALAQVLSGILEEGLVPQDAVDRPRLHSTGHIVHVEPGFEAAAIDALLDEGYDVRLWSARHHYFGGVSAIARAGGAADPRRSGSALNLS
jgi:gamma-glutamyltranspeptidase / glutathione hydrolase